MEDPKARQLFDQVLKKTKVGRISWTPTANDAEFLTVLPGGFAFVVTKTNQRDSYGNWDEQFSITLRGADSDLLHVTADNGIRSEEFVELYELARRKALGVDETVDKLLLDLAKM